MGSFEPVPVMARTAIALCQVGSGIPSRPSTTT